MVCLLCNGKDYQCNFVCPVCRSRRQDNIRQLEEELHAVLFVRTSHGMAPTESGRFLYERSGRVIRQLEEIENGLRQLEQRRERIRIGCANGALNLLPLGVILAFGAAHPEFRLEWREYPNDQVKKKLLDSEIEALIEERSAARKAKNFARADEIRAELLAKGIILEDTREGVKWKRA